MSTYQHPQHQINQLLNYFSSYLSDTTFILSDIKNLVYQLIDIELPQVKGMKINPEIFDIMAGCKKTYEDLRRTQCILKGHLKARRSSRSVTTGRNHLAINQFQMKDKLSKVVLTPKQSQFVKVESIETPIVTRTKIYTSDYWKVKVNKDDQNSSKTNELNDKQRSNTPATIDSPKQQNEQICSLTRSRSLQILKQFETIKQDKASKMKTFQKDNLQCLTIIKKIKEQIKITSIKKKQRKSKQ